MRTGPIVYRYADAALGEVRRPIATIPEISVLLEHEVEYARAERAVRPDDACVRAFGGDDVRATSTCRSRCRRAQGRFGDAPRDAQAVRRREPVLPRSGQASRRTRLDRRDRDESRRDVRARLRADRVRAHSPAAVVPHVHGADRGRERDVRRICRIGYIRGVGDNVMPMLEELGLPVAELDPVTLPQTKLSQFTTIVLGPRACTRRNPAAMLAEHAAAHAVRAQRRNGRHAVRPAGAHAAGRTAVSDHARPTGRSCHRRERAGARARSRIAAARHAEQDRRARTSRTGCRSGRCTCRGRSTRSTARVFSMNDKGEPPNDAAVLVAPVGKGDVRLHDVRVLPAVAGGQSRRRAAVHQPSLGGSARGNRPTRCHRLCPTRP